MCENEYAWMGQTVGSHSLQLAVGSVLSVPTPVGHIHQRSVEGQRMSSVRGSQIVSPILSHIPPAHIHNRQYLITG